MRPIGLHRLLAVATVFLALSLAACSPPGGAGTSNATTPPASSGAPAISQVILVTHDSWSVPKGLLASFTSQTGYSVTVLKTGDAGELTNKLVLTKGNPIGDVAYGVDNTFASRAIDAGVFADYSSPSSTAEVDRYRIASDPNALTPIDWGDVCVNIDDVWFAQHHIAPPKTLSDLTLPAYKGLFVTEAATTSSPGLAFLLATIAEFGDTGAFDYWRALVANGTRIDAGWEKAYFTDFTGGGGGGSYPIVLSYNSDPAYTIPKGKKKPTTSAMLDTCFRQVEYAGVLAGAKNPSGAQALVDFMLTDQFQSVLPENMYVFPVRSDVKLPAAWTKWAPITEHPLTIDPATVAANRDEWLKKWVDATSG
jgi:thiamine transport system substrate-binding protein